MATAILGMQWGDEGKGKVTHLLAREAQMVVRFNGWPNAGHTVIDRGVKFGTHQIPAGAFYPGVRNVLANGMVIDIWGLRQEFDAIASHLGHPAIVIIARNAHLIMPYHRILEEVEGSGKAIGTTKRGIGPAYRDKAERVGIRADDLLHPQRLHERLTKRLDLLHRMWPEAEPLATLTAPGLMEDLLETASPLLSSIGDATDAIREGLTAGKEILFEGAQGALLDLDFGTYPYVTSSATTFAGLGNAIGIPTPRIERRLGVVKAYTTRVGGGPFPSELAGVIGEWLRERGEEFGTTTGRPRRCGWLDLVALRHAVSLNNPTGLAITKLDVLSGLEEIKLCRAYRLGERKIDRFPLSTVDLAESEPVYKSLPGWKEEIREVRDFGDLPPAARTYVEYISQELGVPISLISVGPAPQETIITGFDRG